jgi:DNA-binding transcriptional MerR regulator
VNAVAEIGATLVEPMPDGKEFTIDELAEATRVPSRTIRFYQSMGALPKPVIKGRVAYYGEAHIERLSQITALQDRGLQIKAIRDVLQQAQKGDFSIQDWLGSHEQLSSPWAGDRPKIMTESEIMSELAGRRPGLVGELVRLGVLERRGDAYLVDSPGLLNLVLRLDKVGLPVDTIAGAFKVLHKHLGRAADDLTSYFVKTELGEDPQSAFDELRPVSLEAVRLVFAREMERAVRKANESGAASVFSKKKRSKRRS